MPMFPSSSGNEMSSPYIGAPNKAPTIKTRTNDICVRLRATVHFLASRASILNPVSFRRIFRFHKNQRTLRRGHNKWLRGVAAAGYANSLEGHAAMTIEIRKPELEQLVQEEILSGHFQNVDDLLTQAIQALREKSRSAQPATRPRKNLA